LIRALTRKPDVKEDPTFDDVVVREDYPVSGKDHATP
jgi:hypothetical protein